MKTDGTSGKKVGSRPGAAFFCGPTQSSLNQPGGSPSPDRIWRGRASRFARPCRQIKDPARNGGRNLSLLHEHLAHDDLVAWGWQPGAGRDPAPGSQALLGDLTQAW